MNGYASVYTARETRIARCSQAIVMQFQQGRGMKILVAQDYDVKQQSVRSRMAFIRRNLFLLRKVGMLVVASYNRGMQRV